MVETGDEERYSLIYPRDQIIESAFAIRLDNCSHLLLVPSCIAPDDWLDCMFFAGGAAVGS